MNPRSGSTVLVVDDSEIDRFLLRAILEGEGYRALSAPDGPTGRGLAAAALPDAILLDVVMPGEDGFATCAALKRDPRTASIPVLFLSALEDADSKVRGLAAGAVDYVTKPPNRDEVLARVALHIRLHRSTELLIREQAERLAVVGAAQKLLLTDPASVPEARVRVFHRTLHEAGGDFYEALPLGSGVWAYVVADVSGHDVGVSLILGALKAILHQNAALLYSPLESMRAMNEVLVRLLAVDQFVTACYVVVNRVRGTVAVVSAACPPVVKVDGQGRAAELHAPGDIVGKFDAPAFGLTETTARQGDRLFLCTDGCLEAPGDATGGRADWERYVEACRDVCSVPLDEAPRLVMERLFPPGSRRGDDQLLLVTDL